MKIRELPGLRVTVDEVIHAPELDAPPDKPYCFVYFLTLHNDSTESVTMRGRKWVVREANGETLVIEGDGIVGGYPHLDPGETYSYNSSHVVALSARAEGAVFGVTAAGEAVFARVPAFVMPVPE